MGELSVRTRRSVTAALAVAAVLGGQLVADLGVAGPAAAATPEPGPRTMYSSDWLTNLNWWRSFGGDQAGNPIPPVTNTPADDVSPRNHADYLQAAKDAGFSGTCTHGAVPGHPRTPGVDYWHNVLICGAGLLAGIEGWNETPFHGEPMLSPRTTRVGAAQSAAGEFATAKVAASTPITSVWTWPRNNGTLPRTRWAGGEIPDPVEMCSPGADGRHWGQPVFVWYPTSRTLVSSTVEDADGTPLQVCALAGHGKASPGTTSSSFILMTTSAYTAGKTYTAKVTTTSTAGTDRTTVPVTFTAADLPRELTVTPGTVVRQRGTANPSFSTTMTGWYGGDSAATNDVTGAPVCTTTATTASPAGTYPITCTTGTLRSTRYAFTTAQGSLVVVDSPVSTTGAAQTVTLQGPSRASYGDTPAVTATASSGLPTTLVSASPSTCTVSGSTVTAVGVGTCVLTAYQTGGNGYRAAGDTVSFPVGKASLTVRPVDASRSPGDAAPEVAVTYTGFRLGDTVETAGITGRPGCTPSPETPGTHTLLCYFPGTFSSPKYVIGPSYYGTLLVGEGLPRTTSTGTRTQYIRGDLPQPAAGRSATLGLTATSGLPLTYTSLTPSVCTITGTTLTAVAPGDCQVGFVQPGDAEWGVRVGTRSYTVAPAAAPKAQTVTFGAAVPSSVTYGSTTPLSATASSGLGVTYSAAGPCTVTGTGLTTTGAGTCTVTATQAGNATWAPATATRTITVGRKALTVTADAKTRVAGQANPAFTHTITGFVAGQTLATSGVTGTPVCTTTATTASPAGSYPITCTTGTLTAANYTFMFTGGTLTVTSPAPTTPAPTTPAPTAPTDAPTSPADPAPSSPAAPASANAPFVKAAYQDFLRRRPTPSELTADTTALDTGTLTRRAFLHRMATSDEWVHVIVTGFYRDTLGRQPDRAGLTHWSTRIATGQETVAQVAGGFYASTEFYNRSGGTDAAWITALYRQILGRDPVASDLRFWSDRAHRLGRVTVATEIYQSLESRNKRVTGLYQALLHRNPDPTGMAYWPGTLLTTGDITLAMELAGSLEYRLRATTRYPNG